MASAQRVFKQWETESSQTGASRNKEQLLEQLGADFLRLLDGVSISRSRRQIERFYCRRDGARRAVSRITKGRTTATRRLT